MKLKTLLALDILNNSCIAHNNEKWLKMTEAEKEAARQAEERSFTNHFTNGLNDVTSKTVAYFFVIVLAIGLWFITVPALIIYIIYKLVNNYKFKKSRRETK